MVTVDLFAICCSSVYTNNIIALTQYHFDNPCSCFLKKCVCSVTKPLSILFSLFRLVFSYSLETQIYKTYIYIRLLRKCWELQRYYTFGSFGISSDNLRLETLVHWWTSCVYSGQVYNSKPIAIAGFYCWCSGKWVTSLYRLFWNLW